MKSKNKKKLVNVIAANMIKSAAMLGLFASNVPVIQASNALYQKGIEQNAVALKPSQECDLSSFRRESIDLSGIKTISNPKDKGTVKNYKNGMNSITAAFDKESKNARTTIGIDFGSSFCVSVNNGGVAKVQDLGGKHAKLEITNLVKKDRINPLTPDITSHISSKEYYKGGKVIYPDYLASEVCEGRYAIPFNHMEKIENQEMFLRSLSYGKVLEKIKDLASEVKGDYDISLSFSEGTDESLKKVICNYIGDSLSELNGHLLKNISYFDSIDADAASLLREANKNEHKSVLLVDLGADGLKLKGLSYDKDNVTAYDSEYTNEISGKKFDKLILDGAIALTGVDFMPVFRTKAKNDLSATQKRHNRKLCMTIQKIKEVKEALSSATSVTLDFSHLEDQDAIEFSRENVTSILDREKVRQNLENLIGGYLKKLRDNGVHFDEIALFGGGSNFFYFKDVIEDIAKKNEIAKISRSRNLLESTAQQH